jgi:hypothetical protein
MKEGDSELNFDRCLGVVGVVSEDRVILDEVEECLEGLGWDSEHDDKPKVVCSEHTEMQGAGFQPLEHGYESAGSVFLEPFEDPDIC